MTYLDSVKVKKGYGGKSSFIAFSDQYGFPEKRSGEMVRSQESGVRSSHESRVRSQESEARGGKFRHCKAVFYEVQPRKMTTKQAPSYKVHRGSSQSLNVMN